MKPISIGTGIGMLVVGAILAFAIRLPNPVIDLRTVGVILLGGGFVALAVGVIFAALPKQSVTTITNGRDAQGRAVSTHRVDER